MASALIEFEQYGVTDGLGRSSGYAAIQRGSKAGREGSPLRERHSELLGPLLREAPLRTLAVLTTSAVLAVATAPAAMATGDPSATGTGPPNQSCQTQDAIVGGVNAQGQATNLLPSTGAANAPGSVFNEPMQISSSGGVSSGGTGGNAYNNAGAPSQ